MREATAVGGVVAVAASLFGAMFFVHRVTHPDRAEAVIPPLAQFKAPPELALAPAPAPAPAEPVVASMEREAVASDAPRAPLLPRIGLPQRESRPVLPARSAEPTVVARGRDQLEAQAQSLKADISLAKAPASAASAAVDEMERAQLKGMLEKPDVHRILIVTDVIDAGERIKALIQRDPRKNPNFARVTVTGGVVIDPRHPGDADVFTVVLDGRESERLLGQIDRNFPQTDVVVDPRPDPQMVAQLTRVGRVAVLPGVSTAADNLPLVVTMEELPARGATRAEPARSLGVTNRLDESAAVLSDMAEADRSHETLPPRFPPTPGPATYLVWVTRPTVRH